MEFEDEQGHGFAQLDAALICSDKILLFECKLTENLHGHAQLRGLYGPLLSFLYPAREIIYILLCKNLRRDLRRFEVNSLEEAIASDSRKVLTWQWLP